MSFCIFDDKKTPPKPKIAIALILNLLLASRVFNVPMFLSSATAREANIRLQQQQNKHTHKTKNLKNKTNEQTNRQKENRRKRIFLHDQYWVQQLAGRRTQAMKITSNQRRQTAATAAWKYILPACVCENISKLFWDVVASKIIYFLAFICATQKK
jgi:hypothetical protein